MVRSRAGRVTRSASLMTAIVLLPALLAGREAAAQAVLQAEYRVTLSGWQIGSGAWTVDIANDHYTMAVTGKTGGLLNVFASGSGAASVRGGISGSRFSPHSYTMSIRTKNHLDEVKMALAAGTIKSLSVEPPVKPSETRVPLTEAHKRGVIDLFSAGLTPRAGANGMGPEACRRTVGVFDGRQRFDLTTSYKRMETVRADGYSGPALVCAVDYNPVGGYERNRFADKYLKQSREIEIWLVPVAGTRFLATYRVGLPTALGPAVLQATRFSVSTRAARPASVDARVE